MGSSFASSFHRTSAAPDFGLLCAALCAKTLSQAFVDRTDFPSFCELSKSFHAEKIAKSFATACLPFPKASYMTSSSCCMGSFGCCSTIPGSHKICPEKLSKSNQTEEKGVNRQQCYDNLANGEDGDDQVQVVYPMLPKLELQEHHAKADVNNEKGSEQQISSEEQPEMD